MARALRIMLLLSVLLAACSFDFTDPPRESPALISVTLSADTRTDRLSMQARLVPGYGTDGRVRRVLTDLVAADTSIAPLGVETDGSVLYVGEWNLSSDLPAGGPLALQAPDLDGMHPTASPSFAIPIPLHAGMDTLYANDADAVVLRVTNFDTTAASVQWHMDLIDGAGAIQARFQFLGYPPAEIVIPASWFPSGAGTYTVQLLATQTYASGDVQDEYGWTAVVHALLQWTVILDGLG